MALNQNLAHIKKLIVLNILKYKSSDISRDHFAKNRKLLTNWWPVYEKKSSNNIFLIHFKYFKHFTIWNDRPLHFNKKLWGELPPILNGQI